MNGALRTFYEVVKESMAFLFFEAQIVFSDENGSLLDDPDHSLEEEFYTIIGMSSTLRLLVISHTYRGEDLITSFMIASFLLISAAVPGNS
jgi:uncharacterized DUF497 family protein